MVKEYRAEVWYPIDMLIDWEKQKIAVFVNSTFEANVGFYHDGDIQSTNTIYLYNLAPGTQAKIKNLQIWDTKCSGAEDMEFTGATLAGAKVLMLVTATFYFLLQ